MNPITVTIKPTANGKKVLVELDADKLERLASSLGLYNPDFIESLDRAERDFRAGRARVVSSLRTLRRKKK